MYTHGTQHTHTDKVCIVVYDFSTGWRRNVYVYLCLPFYLPFRYYARKVLHLTERNMCHSRHVYGAAFVQLENLHKFTLKMLSHPEASTNFKQFRGKHISSW